MRVSFLVDGFNVYHSLADVESEFKQKVKWLNLRRLCESYLPSLGRGATPAEFYYFSAHATHMTTRDANVVNRHQVYIRALQSTGVKIQLGMFKAKRVKCHHCHREFTKYEEKETDVSIAVKIFELFQQNLCDQIVLLTGDTDLIPAVVTARRLYQKPISIIFPYKRINAAFSSVTDQQFKIKKDTYEKYQFDDPLTVPAGEIRKPGTW
ncbi:NYN domain-containing protein [Turneriella parva]|uniref:NYN domain-containing protein n=1 Tax=Turneriella parva (strain ATCC BAA-1111 / DSM 21527 / NCTC 11395 / H) TaxID=869212 RepID=I4B6Q4_TURPD|nr:NYN domain-containing protein [Turneriella parva]AFM12961.1 protein of unknown function DUF88 [Turneriella parva DSM 21527]